MKNRVYGLRQSKIKLIMKYKKITVDYCIKQLL
jgi:hypothetical protein